MCPVSEIGLNRNEDQIFTLLNGYTPDTHLPNNVVTDVNPYLGTPSNLPEGCWYLVQSNEKKESDHGFWKAKGDACKIYSNSVITGWRTTLEYLEGRPPHGQRTDWLMQEYTVTQKESSDKDKSKDTKLLCRVFLSNGPDGEIEMHLKNLKPTNDNKTIDSVTTIDAKATGALTGLDGKNSDSSPPVLSVHECIERGDFLELDDLEDPESQSSSSQNSTCPSNLSDEYFDHLALLREMKEDSMVLQTASSGMLSESIKVVEDSQPGSGEKGKQQVSPKGHSSDDSIAGSSSPSDGDKNPGPSEGKKAAAHGSRRMKILKTYFCFASF